MGAPLKRGRGEGGKKRKKERKKRGGEGRIE